jgi:uncharacterized membrane protein YjjP (DUF1212 family)
MGYGKYFRTHPPTSSEAFEEASFFRKPLSRSPFFRRNTLAMILASSFATLLLAGFWSTFTFAVRALLICGILTLILAWIRSIFDHRKIRALLDTGENPNISDESLSAAASQLNGGLWSTCSLAFFLFLAILLLMGHYERRAWQDQLMEKARQFLHR